MPASSWEPCSARLVSSAANSAAELGKTTHFSSPTREQQKQLLMQARRAGTEVAPSCLTTPPPPPTGRRQKARRERRRGQNISELPTAFSENEHTSRAVHLTRNRVCLGVCLQQVKREGKQDPSHRKRREIWGVRRVHPHSILAPPQTALLRAVVSGFSDCRQLPEVRSCSTDRSEPTRVPSVPETILRGRQTKPAAFPTFVEPPGVYLLPWREKSGCFVCAPPPLTTKPRGGPLLV